MPTFPAKLGPPTKKAVMGPPLSEKKAVMGPPLSEGTQNALWQKDPVTGELRHPKPVEKAPLPVRPEAPPPPVRAAGLPYPTNIPGVDYSVLRAQESTAIDTLRRKANERWVALEAELPKIQDPAARKVAFEKASKDVANLRSNMLSADQEYQRQHADSMPQRQARFNDVDRQMTIRRLHDEMVINDQADYQDADALRAEENFAFRQIKAREAGLITPEEAKAKIDNFGTERAFARAGVLLGKGDPESLEQAKVIAEGVVAKTPQQQQRANQLKAVVVQQLENIQKQNYDAKYDAILELDQIETPAEHYLASEALNKSIIEDVKAGKIDPHKANTLQNARRASDSRFKAATQETPDEMVQGEFYDRLATMQTDDDFKALRQWMNENQAAFGKEFGTRVKELYAGKKSGERVALKSAVDMVLGTDPAQERGAFYPFILSAIKAREAELKRKLTDEETHEFVAGRHVSWENARPKPMFTPKEVEVAVGKLAGDKYLKNGESPAFDLAVEWLQSELGMDWAKHAPKAVEILTKKYPANMWANVPMKEKVAIAEDMVKRAKGWNDEPPAGGWDNDDLNKAQEIFGDGAKQSTITIGQEEAWDAYVAEKYPTIDVPAAAPTPVKISSKAEYDALAPGTPFVWKDGRAGTK